MSNRNRYDQKQSEEDSRSDRDHDDPSRRLKMKLINDMHDFLRPSNDMIDRHKDSQIALFYKDRSVFITGASGFVGKCILEKLLRSCPEVKEIFILMRPKRGLEVGERVEALLRSELFDRLKKLPNGLKQLEKVHPVKGDITKPLFGLTDENIELLAKKVSVLMHSAATVKFEEPLRVAVSNNVISVENLIDVASRLVKLEALVHVSTAYSNCDRTEVDEVFYETPMQADRLIEMSRWMKDEVMDRISPELLSGTNRPNTYTYTKAVAESLVLDRASKLLPNLPIAVVRPSIVAGIWAQPIRGWVDNFNGPTGVMLAMMSGSLQAVHVFPNYCADIVPVDMVANLIICSAWQINRSQGVQNENGHTNKKPIVNYESNSHANNNGHSHMMINKTIMDGKVVSENCNPGATNKTTSVMTITKSNNDDHHRIHHHHHNYNDIERNTKDESKRKIDNITQKAESQNGPTTHIITQTNTTTDGASTLVNKQHKQITIFNCVSGSLNPLSWRDFSTSMVKMAKTYPINAAMRQPGSLLISNAHLFKIYNFFDHSSFAYMGDFLLKLTGQKTKLVPLHNRLMKMITTLEPFTTNQWVFNCSNTTGLYNDMSPIDKEIFNFDLTQVEWSDYLQRYYVGSKVFALKDDPMKMFGTKRRLNFMSSSSKYVQIILIIMAYYYLVMGTSLETQTIDSLTKYWRHFSILSSSTTTAALDNNLVNETLSFNG